MRESCAEKTRQFPNILTFIAMFNSFDSSYKVGRRREENESKFLSVMQQDFFRQWQRERKRQFYSKAIQWFERDTRVNGVDERE